PNDSDAGESVAEGVLVPVPLRLAVCGLLLALSLTDSVALRLPVAVGVQVRTMVQRELAASEVAELLVWAKSPLLVPVMPILLMVTVELPALATVTYTLSLHDALPILPNDSDAGESVAEGVLVPVPVRLAVCGLLLALSLTASVALRLPVAVGVNVTLMVQLEDRESVV